ncbi:winged helix-turn-helix transcriptional regulator [Altererythrobacter sp. CC-YST694]|uniref:MarR family winged helix-turn-helix transcriptional regulator n=1 Tax=Altererythrobacter sp. CC-YST694 TaxID=2755038 RepID=UPI001D020B5D|nr:MarR family winged helix-turn-helix transcriptional regulator [Altererythrobacter sp. CC-YST694]MCB5423782.1 winged helix-turn-helix transcriptional regulator [Altererythrobacter sp. CC-YST694]
MDKKNLRLADTVSGIANAAHLRPVPQDPFLHRICAVSARMRSIASREVLSQHGLDLRDWLVLSGLFELGLGSQRDLVDLAKLDKVAVNRAAARLKEGDLVEVRPNRLDGRSHLLELSEKGRTIYFAISSEIEEMERLVLAQFSPAETEQFRRMLARLEAALEDVDRAGAEEADAAAPTAYGQDQADGKPQSVAA